jgi:hypothetical protein
MIKSRKRAAAAAAALMATAPAVATVAVVAESSPASAGVCAYPPKQGWGFVYTTTNCHGSWIWIEVWQNNQWNKAGSAVHTNPGDTVKTVVGACYGGNYKYRTHYVGDGPNAGSEYWSNIHQFNC